MVSLSPKQSEKQPHRIAPGRGNHVSYWFSFRCYAKLAAGWYSSTGPPQVLRDTGGVVESGHHPSGAETGERQRRCLHHHGGGAHFLWLKRSGVSCLISEL